MSQRDLVERRRRQRPMSSILGGAFGLAVAACAATAQCMPQWQPGSGAPGIVSAWLGEASVGSTALWDPDGNGPLPQRLAIAGRFTLVVDAVVDGVASMDLATGQWAPIGSIQGPAWGLTPLASGSLAALTSSGVKIWNGSAWTLVGAPPRGAMSLLALPNGDLVTNSPEYIEVMPGWSYWQDQLSRWNGSGWSSISPVIHGGRVWCAALLPNGDVVAAGDFTHIGGSPYGRIARWDGAAWHPLGSGIGGRVHGMTVLPNGDVVVIGNFAVAGAVAANMIARWDGANWSALGTGVPGPPVSVRTSVNGDVWVGGALAVGTDSLAYLTRWNGSAWSQPITGLTRNEPFVRHSQILQVQPLPSQEVFVAGSFNLASGTPALGAAIWSSSGWRPLGSGLDTAVRTMASTPNGDIVTGGQGPGLNSIMRWDGVSWTLMGRMTGSTLGLTSLSNGDVVAAGSYELGPGITQPVVRWNGQRWASVGNLTMYVNSIATLANDDIIVGVEPGWGPGTRMMRWDGSSWTAFGGVVDGRVGVLHRTPSGDLLVAGNFTSFGGVPARSIVRWNGATWSSLGSGPNGNIVRAVVEMRNGDIVLATGSQMESWDGSSWTTIGSFMNAYALLELPDGSLLAGGDFLFSPIGRFGVARWDGVNWSHVAGALDAEAQALGAMRNGDIMVGGSFTAAGGRTAAFAVRLASPCPATVVPLQTMCTTASGPLSLRAETLPWIGADYRTRGVGFAPGSLGAAVLGFAPQAVPLSLLHPAGLPGCFLSASPDAVSLLLPIGGVAEQVIRLPRNPGLVGSRAYHQHLQMEFGAGGTVSSSNALLLTIGMF